MSIDFTEIFCYVDDFFQELDKQTNSISQNNNKSGPKNRLNRSEIITALFGRVLKASIKYRGNSI